MASSDDPPLPGDSGPPATGKPAVREKVAAHEKAADKERLAAALRDNLRRRKSQKVGRADSKARPPGTDPV